MIEGVWYYVEVDKVLRLVLLKGDYEHRAWCSWELGDTKMHGELSKHYWWCKMRTDNSKWCQGCLVCADCCPLSFVYNHYSTVVYWKLHTHT